MKRSHFLYVSALCLSGIALTAASSAAAGGVDAGTLIEATASASYTTGGASKTVDSNKVSIRVDELLDAAVATLDSGAVAITDDAVLAFSVTNAGNGPESFVLTADGAMTGNDFDATVNGLAIDSDGNGVYDAGTDTPIANGSASGAIDADESITVFVLLSAPGGMTDGDTSKVRLTAEAVTGTGSPGTVFSGKGEGGGDAVVGSSGAKGDDLGSLVASLASVALTKSANVVDPFGGGEAVPGATITYTLVASVGGSGSVSGLTITDNFPAGTSYVPGSLKMGATSLSDASDGDAGTVSGTGLAVVIGSLDAGKSRTIKFDVTIDN